jgi:hypothetical protein
MKKEANYFMLRKIFLMFILTFIFVFTLSHCEKKTGVPEGSKTEEITVGLTPSTQEVKSEFFTLQLSGLKIIKTIDKPTKELTITPSLRGSIKISNHSKNILDIQGVILQYLDGAGNPIPFKTGEKKVTVSTFWTDLSPGKELENSLDVTIPMAAVKANLLNKIQVTVVYVLSPLERETMEVPVRIEEK